MALSILDTVKKVAPNAHANYLGAIAQGDTLFHQHGITTPLRIAHFLAQTLHETGGFTLLRESMKYSASRLTAIFGVHHHSAAITPAEAIELAYHDEAIAERVYGLGNPYKAQELGNTQPGDGYLYRGNGILQTTGRSNHRRMGQACGVDFENYPELVTAPEHALKPALQEWTEDKLNTLADKNDINTLTKRINGGFNGLPERQAWFDKIWPLVNTSTDTEAWQIASVDDNVSWLQTALNTLGASPLPRK